MQIEINYDNQTLTVEYSYIKEIEGYHIYAIYDDMGADLYDEYEEQGDLDSIMEEIMEQEQLVY